MTEFDAEIREKKETKITKWRFTAVGISGIIVNTEYRTLLAAPLGARDEIQSIAGKPAFAKGARLLFLFSKRDDGQRGGYDEQRVSTDSDFAA